MSPVVSVILLGALLAAPENSAPPKPKVDLQVWVVEVEREGRDEPFFDKGLDEIRAVVSDPEHDTYKRVKVEKHSFEEGKNLRMPLTDRYTLDTTIPARAPDGRYRFGVRVTMKSDKPTKSSGNPLLQPDALLAPQKNTPRQREIEALSSKLSMQPDEKVVVRGLKLEGKKEMVVVLSLTAPKEGNNAD